MRWSRHCWGGARGAREHRPVSSCLVKPAQSLHQSHFIPLNLECGSIVSGADGVGHLPCLSTSLSPGEHRVPLPPTCLMIANEITSASREGAISLLHWVITLYKRPAQLSARPGPHTPGQARMARSHLLAAGSVDTASRAGSRSWEGEPHLGLPGPWGQSQEEWCIPAVTPQPSSA